MSDNKQQKTGRDPAVRFITKLGAHIVHTAGFTLWRAGTLIRNTAKLIKRPHREKAPAGEKPSLKTAALNMVFPAVCIAVLAAAVKVTLSGEYGVAVELCGTELGMIESDSVFGNAQREVSEIMEGYQTDGEYYKTARLTLRRMTSSDTLIDEAVLADKMEQQISSIYPPAVKQQEEETVLPEELPEIPAQNMSDIVSAYMVTVDKRCIGFVYEYDEIQSALDELMKPCLELEDVDPASVSFNKEVVLDTPYEINKMAVVDQDKIIDILLGYESEPEYYEVQLGDALWKIAEEKEMPLEELKSCVATYNGKIVELGDNLKVGTIIELQSLAPYLSVTFTKREIFERELGFETIEINDDTLFMGEKQVEKEGSAGIERVTAVVTYELFTNEDGTDSVNDISRKIISTESIVQPVSQVVRVGTKPRTASAGTYAGHGEYFWPVDGGYISSHFGGDRNHKGLDIAAPYGTPIYAAASGTVTTAGWNNGGYGNYVIIQNDDGNITYYAHQSLVACEAGDVVEAGDLIGYVGSTGDSTGNHLHFEVRKDGLYLDPETFVSQ